MREARLILAVFIILWSLALGAHSILGEDARFTLRKEQPDPNDVICPGVGVSKIEDAYFAFQVICNDDEQHVLWKQ
tara:strand:- start:7249 stop:7476 length:228 start_codon:yes stop_codon:yes gene_type:complete